MQGGNLDMVRVGSTAMAERVSTSHISPPPSGFQEWTLFHLEIKTRNFNRKVKRR